VYGSLAEDSGRFDTELVESVSLIVDVNIHLIEEKFL